MNSEAIAKALLEIKAVSVVDKEHLFTWASGIKSPIYCDNRLTMSYPKVRSMIADGFVEKIKRLYPNAQVIAGTATAGIPHAAWVAERLNLPMVYVRSSAKQHGKGNQIEGRLLEGQRVVLIEDLISTGGSSLAAAEVIRQAGAEVMAIIAIFSYNFAEAEQRFADAKVAYATLTDYRALLPVAVNAGYISDKDLAELSNWRLDPRMFTPKEDI